jgi:hypothetical protein
MSKHGAKDWLSPARDVVAKFDSEDVPGIRRLAGFLSVSETVVYRWMYTKDRQGGTGGMIPVKYHRSILELARQLGIPLTPSELTGLTEFDPPVNSPRRPNRRRLVLAGPELPLQAAE